MSEAEWLACAKPADMWHSEFIGPREPDRQHRLFAAACCRRIWHRLPDDRCRQAVETLERFADGLCTEADRDLELATLQNQPDLYAGLSDTQARAMSAALACAGWNGVDYLRLAIEAAEDCAAAEAFTRGEFDLAVYSAEERAQCDYIRDMFPNPSRAVIADPSWPTSTVVALAAQMYESRDFSPMPILADALQDAGCDNADILDHCRGPGPHVRGCWVVDLLLNKG
jgi:hypothetical protein